MPTTLGTVLTVLTGAGISAESGLSTFRAVDGLWEQHRIEDVATPEGFAADPALVHRFYNMRRAAAQGFINATDCADYLTKKGMPFRDAYKCTGTMVAACIAAGKTLEELTLDEFKQYVLSQASSTQ